MTVRTFGTNSGGVPGLGRCVYLPVPRQYPDVFTKPIKFLVIISHSLRFQPGFRLSHLTIGRLGPADGRRGRNPRGPSKPAILPIQEVRLVASVRQPAYSR